MLEFIDPSERILCSICQKRIGRRKDLPECRRREAGFAATLKKQVDRLRNVRLSSLILEVDKAGSDFRRCVVKEGRRIESIQQDDRQLVIHCGDLTILRLEAVD